MNPDEIELIEQYIDGTLQEADADRLRSLLLENSEARSLLRSLATVDLGIQDIVASNKLARELVGTKTTSTLPVTVSAKQPWSGFAKSLLAIAGVAVACLAGALWLQQLNYESKIAGLNAEYSSLETSAEPKPSSKIAKIAEMAGVVVWTGDGGSISKNLKAGSELTGGTIEGASPNSWVKLEFKDGSTVTVFGNSRLTFSDFGQKVLHLREGKLTSNVEPQPSDKPMLVHTRTALMEVLGTEFNVESEVDTTSLNVTEGKVRLKHLVDGTSIDVPANNRVIAASGSKLETELIPAITSRWKSRLEHWPHRVFGKWNPKTGAGPATVKLVPYQHTTTTGKTISTFNMGVAVSDGKSSLIVLKEDSQIRVKGHVKRPQPDMRVYFGVSARDSKGNHHGNFLEFDRKLTCDSQGRFECILNTKDLLPESSQGKPGENDLSAVNKIVENFFCSMLDDLAGLEISEIEIFRESDN